VAVVVVRMAAVRTDTEKIGFLEKRPAPMCIGAGLFLL
jgi:hypothetical protein